MTKRRQQAIESTARTGTGQDGVTLTHPAFAQIGAYRTSGHATLYGSDFPHQHYITIRIARSQLDRHLSNDWPHAREELIEVALSEAQWATFVSSMNMGGGVQCTLQHIGREPVPALPDPEDRRILFGREMDETQAAAHAHLDKLTQALAASGLSNKAKAELMGHVNMAKQKIGSSTKFVADQFGEHMETVTQRAMMEVNAWALAMSGGRAPSTAIDQKPAEPGPWIEAQP